MLADALDTDRSLLVDTVANGPLDNTEVDSVGLAAVQALVECLSVEKMAAQADGKSLQVVALSPISLSRHGLICLSQQLDVCVVWRQSSMNSDASVADFLW